MPTEARCSSHRTARTLRSLTALLAGVALAVGLSDGAARAATTGPMQPGIWQHHAVSTAYFGVTTVFTCSSIEDDVKQMLLYFGARADVKVTASCSHLIRPVPAAVVHSDFYTLEPASPGVADTVPGQWVKVQMMPHRPLFMDQSECELVDQFKSLFISTFSLRDVRYRTLCTPYEASLLNYNVNAEVLQPVSRH